MTTPLVTIVIPARDEAAYIEACLRGIRAQTYPHSSMEVFVVDGASTDTTAAVARKVLADGDFLNQVVIANEAATTPSNLNRGLHEAAGTYICRVDARSVIPPRYVERCVEILTERPDISVVGGSQVAVAPHPTQVGRGIARALNNRWAMGFSRYRRGAASGRSDTVYLGFFRTAQLRAAGGWDDRLLTNQDFDLNRRMSSLGTVWFDASLAVDYIPRGSYRDLFRQYRRFGSWKVRYWRTSGDCPRPRQVVLLSFPAGVVGLGLLAAARPRALPRLLLTAGAAAGVVEVTGNRAPAKVCERIYALGGLACIVAAWLAGAWGELLRGVDRRPDDGRTAR